MGRGIHEVQESLLEMTRIYLPQDPGKFVKDFVKKYRITRGYEEELTELVQVEMVRLASVAYSRKILQT